MTRQRRVFLVLVGLLVAGSVAALAAATPLPPVKLPPAGPGVVSMMIGRYLAKSGTAPPVFVITGLPAKLPPTSVLVTGFSHVPGAPNDYIGVAAIVNFDGLPSGPAPTGTTLSPMLSISKAVNFAIDRPAMLRQRGAFAGQRNDQILPPGMPGYRDVHTYPGARVPKEDRGPALILNVVGWARGKPSPAFIRALVGTGTSTGTGANAQSPCANQNAYDPAFSDYAQLQETCSKAVTGLEFKSSVSIKAAGWLGSVIDNCTVSADAKSASCTGITNIPKAQPGKVYLSHPGGFSSGGVASVTLTFNDGTKQTEHFYPH